MGESEFQTPNIPFQIHVYTINPVWTEFEWHYKNRMEFKWIYHLAYRLIISELGKKDRPIWGISYDGV